MTDDAAPVRLARSPPEPGGRWHWLIVVLACGLGLGATTVAAQPRIYRVALEITDQVDTAALPEHMRVQHPLVVRGFERDFTELLTTLGRAEVRQPTAVAAVDFVVRASLHEAHKTYINKIIDRTAGHFDDAQYGQGLAGGSSYEVVSLPSITCQVEVVLVDAADDEVLWSASHEESETVPHNERVFVYNSWKYPGLSDPDMVRAFLADILRLQEASPWVDRALNVADRWFISAPGRDLETTRQLVPLLVASFAGELNDNLPLEGRIEAVLPQPEGPVQVRLNIGRRHGLQLGLRLDVYRSGPGTQQVGQVEVVGVDSVSALARLRKLDRSVRKRGEGLREQDRVISPSRVSGR